MKTQLKLNLAAGEPGRLGANSKFLQTAALQTEQQTRGALSPRQEL